MDVPGERGRPVRHCGRSRAALLMGAVALLVVPAAGCGLHPRDTIPMNWRRVTAPELHLVSGIQVFEGHNPDLPLRAWYVRVEERDPRIETRVVVAADTDRRETPAQFAQRTGAEVVVNGGYFLMDPVPAEHVGLLFIGGHTIAGSSEYITRDGVRYPVVRAVLGLAADGGLDVAWAASRGDSLFEWPFPVLNRPGVPAASVDFSRGRFWPMRDALAAGPALVTDGEVAITVDEEVFFGSSIPQVHPRTAAGHTRRGELILLVVDGRQPASRGVDLRELAVLMRDLGCGEALNLDGGGSSALVVGGILLNRPAGGSVQREVMSALAVFVR
jgi:hypothetical protein